MLQTQDPTAIAFLLYLPENKNKCKKKKGKQNKQNTRNMIYYSIQLTACAQRVSLTLLAFFIFFDRIEASTHTFFYVVYISDVHREDNSFVCMACI